MRKSGHIPSYKISELLNARATERDFEFYPFEYFVANIDHLKYPHRHDHFALFFVVKGTGSHLIDFKDYDLKAQRIFFMAPGQVHAWKSFQGVRGYVLLFTREFFTLTLQYRELRAYLFSNIAHQYTYLDLDDDTSTRVQGIFRNIAWEYQHPKKYSEHIIRSCINIILFELTRVYEQSIPLTDVNDVQFAQVREFENMVNKNFKTMRSVSDYASHLHITANYLNAICQRRRGISAGEIIRNRIMLEARRLLTHSENTVAQIAYDLNFEDNSYFGRFFKKYSGHTPAEFRDEVKKDTFVSKNKGLSANKNDLPKKDKS